MALRNLGLQQDCQMVSSMNSHVTDLTVSQLDTSELRSTLGEFATGVTVVTTVGDLGAPVGLAVNSFSSVSLDPPLILWSLALTAPSLRAFRSHSSFAVNILCDQSKDLALNFARPSPDKFAGIDWQPGHDNVPVLSSAAAVLECETEQRIPAGDHEIYLGRLHRFRKTGKPPLLFHGGKFLQLGEQI